MSVNFGNLLHATAVLLALATTSRAAPAINEIDPNQVGSVDSQEFIELAGTPLSSLNGYVVVLFNGATETSYRAFDLDGYTVGPTGYFLLGNVGVTPTPDIVFPDITLQNGADASLCTRPTAATFLTAPGSRPRISWTRSSMATTTRSTTRC